MSANFDISDGLLFLVAESLSPRLAWMKKHEIISYYHAPGHGIEPTWFAAYQDLRPGLSGSDFFAVETAENGDSRIAEGETEDEALANAATIYGLRLWNEEGVT